MELSEAAAVIYTPEMRRVLEECAAKKGKAKRHFLRTDQFGECFQKGQKLIDAGNTSYAKHKIDPFAMGTLLFTSGTTGVAKGVMLSQRNLMSVVLSARRKVYINCNDCALSILPLHHTFECSIGLLAMLHSGVGIGYVDSLRTIMADLQLYRPTLIVVVPLLMEKFHANILKKVAAQRFGKAVYFVTRSISDLAYSLNVDVRRRLFRQVQDSFGGRLRLIMCGAAALRPEIIRDFRSFGFAVIQGYGLTEAAPLCIMNNDSVQTNDTIGVPVAGVYARIDEPDENGVGELAVRGNNVMLGYYHAPEETAKVLRDGWLYTGDLATVDSRGCYRIVGRIKNVIVTKNGKNIYPEELESYLDDNRFVSEAMVVGEDAKGDDLTVRAIIYPDFDAVNWMLAEQNIDPDSPEYDGVLRELFADVVREINEQLPHYKTIRHFTVRKVDFERNTARKIKRANVGNLYHGADIDG